VTEANRFAAQFRDEKTGVGREIKNLQILSKSPRLRYASCAKQLKGPHVDLESTGCEVLF